MQKAPAEARLLVKGMTCAHCQMKIEQALTALPGVESAKASFSKGTARILYDPSLVGMKDFESAIRGAGYSVKNQPEGTPLARAAGFVGAILLAYLLLSKVSGGALAGILPLAQEGMGYGMLFLIGLITSVHCVVMCGGINMSQCMGAAGKQMNGGGKGALKPSLLYNLGRVVSYTVVGALVGALGSAVSFTGAMKGAVQAAAGVFMVIMGLSMTGLFPWLSRLVPRMPSGVAKKLNRRKGSAGPFYVGLINGLMPCGPLQAMQLYALSTGNPLSGALSMLVFSLGTVPLMFALGAASSLLSRRFTKRAMAVGAVLVAALGLTMLNGGLNLAGVRLSPGSVAATTAIAEQAPASQGVQGVQKVRTTLASGRYEPITVTAGTPVEWTIDAPQGSINGCNGRMVIPAFGVEHAFTAGENVIKFTPDKAGVYPYSCWMGMITSTITVVAPGESVAPPAANGSPSDGAEAPATSQGSCCAGGAAAGQAPDSNGAAPTLGSCCGSAGVSGSIDGSTGTYGSTDGSIDGSAGGSGSTYGSATPGSCCGSAAFGSGQ